MVLKRNKTYFYKYLFFYRCIRQPSWLRLMGNDINYYYYYYNLLYKKPIIHHSNLFKFNCNAKKQFQSTNMPCPLLIIIATLLLNLFLNILQCSTYHSGSTHKYYPGVNQQPIVIPQLYRLNSTKISTIKYLLKYCHSQKKDFQPRVKNVLLNSFKF